MARPKKEKLVHHISTDKEKTKIVDFYTDMLFFKEKPVSEAFIERLAQQMVDWSKQDDSLRITQFFNKCGIPNSMLYKWMDRFPVFKAAHEFTMSALADRRDIGALTRKYDGNYIEKSMGMYDPEYRKFMEWRASLADKNKDAQGTLVVQMLPAPQTETVPIRRSKEDREN